VHGRITSCNDVFLRIAAYTPEEMLGAAHSIVRHPDMPRCVFQLLWDRLLAGRPIGAYVKNLTSAGEYYWVFALAMPIHAGFLSLRLKPTSERLAVVQRLYTHLLDVERSAGHDKAEAIAKGTATLEAALGELGCRDYDEFMGAALRGEVEARERALLLRGSLTAARRSPFQDLPLLDALAQEAAEQAEALESVSIATHRIALNSAIAAARLAESGAALGVLSEQVAELASSIQAQAYELEAARRELGPVFESITFQVSFATLVAETSASFGAQARASRASAAEQRATFGDTLPALGAMLDGVLRDSLARTQEAVLVLGSALRRFDRIGESFRRVLLTSEFSHVTGRTLAATILGGGDYAALLADLSGVTGSARKRLDTLLRATHELRSAVQGWRLAETRRPAARCG